jgi:putative ABC transport system permease protein
MGTLFQDLRQLRKTRGMALLAVVTLAFGVGANTAIFTVIESVVLRPLPYTHPDRLLYIGPAGNKQSFGATSWRRLFNHCQIVHCVSFRSLLLG